MILAFLGSDVILLKQFSRMSEEVVVELQSPSCTVWSISMSRTFPRSCYGVSYAIKNQRGVSKKPIVGGFGCDELVLYGIRELA